MIEHAEKTNGDISRDLFVASSAKWLGYTLMDGKGVIENGPEDDYQPQSSEWRLPGWQRRHMNAEKRQALEEENAKKQDAIDKENEAKEKKRKEQSLEARFRRFWMSGFAGIALVGPMLLMVLHRDQTTALATTSVAVVLFTIIIAIAARTASPEVAVGAVAAYAAVLVVFVGSALPPP
ncbi:hypothetical protein B0O99DRAFT_636160 [Bisporella sp. PMI_857]|nr:hypothetical protein B0O99DRAFT_636160 [Bisporella sp. PMI_857]